MADQIELSVTEEPRATPSHHSDLSKTIPSGSVEVTPTPNGANTTGSNTQSPQKPKDQFVEAPENNPYSAVYKPLKVMQTELPNEGVRQTTNWDRRFIRSGARLWVWLVSWTWLPKDDEDNPERDVLERIGRYFLACLALAFVVWIPSSPLKKVKTGKFPPPLYKFMGYARNPRNEHEKENRSYLDGEKNDDFGVQGIEDATRSIWPTFLAGLILKEGVKRKAMQSYYLYRYKPSAAPSDQLQGFLDKGKEISDAEDAPGEAYSEISSEDEEGEGSQAKGKGSVGDDKPEDEEAKASQAKGKGKVEDDKPEEHPVKSNLPLENRAKDKGHLEGDKLKKKQQKKIDQPPMESSILPSYVVLSYTGSNIAEDDLPQLMKIGERIARRKGYEAFWSSYFGTMPVNAAEKDNTDGTSSEVYKMSDIIRSAAEVVIVLDRRNSGLDAALLEWGRRLWTFPEVLISTNKIVEIYFVGEPLNTPPVRMNKYALAEKAWRHDYRWARQLVDHYEGTIHLSRLELSLIALRCLLMRETISHFPGDVSYVLMGLYRRRPLVDGTDTAFQAFAKLSMLSDSDRLLERAISMLTPQAEVGHSWLSLNDQYKSQLWDIQPEIDISGICHEDQTVIVNNAFGTHIIWKKFPEDLSYIKKTFESWILNFGLIFFIVGVALVATNTVKEVGVVFLLFCVCIIFGVPHLLETLFRRDVPHPEPYLLGFEGCLHLRAIEHRVFGRYYGWLSWDPFGSTLSIHRKISKPHRRQIEKKVGIFRTRRVVDIPDSTQFHECEGMSPMKDSNIRAIIQAADNVIAQNGLRVFTLVNTATGLVTLIQARHPPTAAFVGGSEGGMKRVVLCSFDWETNTLYRESVIRMDTPVVDKMHRFYRFKFGFHRP